MMNFHIPIPQVLMVAVLVISMSLITLFAVLRIAPFNNFVNQPLEELHHHHNHQPHHQEERVPYHADMKNPVTSPPSPPNILLLFPDQWRYDWDGRLNYSDLPLDIPTIRSLTRRGTQFLHAYVPSPLCAPGRACVASGLEYDHAGVPTNQHNDYDIHIPTFYTNLRDKYNYTTYTVGKDDLTKASKLGTKIHQGNWTGLYHQYELGFTNGSLRCSGKLDVISTPTKPHERYGHWLQQQSLNLHNGTIISGWEGHTACMIQTNQCTSELYPDKLYEDNFVTNQAISILKKERQKQQQASSSSSSIDSRRNSIQPWFLQVNFPGPHPPFLVTPKQYSKVINKTFPPPIDNPKNSEKETCTKHRYTKTTSRCNYAAEMENLDTNIAKILDLVNTNTTIVCFSSDHGEMLLDHGWNGKTVPWQGSVSVPLICVGPNIQKNTKITRPISTIDLAATFLDYAASSSSSSSSTSTKSTIGTSESLRNLLEVGEDDEQYRDYVSSGLQDIPFGDHFSSNSSKNNWRMVVEATSGLKFICCKGFCRGTPSTIPHNLTPIGYQQILIDTINDPFDMVPLNDRLPISLKRLRSYLPESFGCN